VKVVWWFVGERGLSGGERVGGGLKGVVSVLFGRLRTCLTSRELGR